MNIPWHISHDYDKQNQVWVEDPNWYNKWCSEISVLDQSQFAREEAKENTFQEISVMFTYSQKRKQMDEKFQSEVKEYNDAVETLKKNAAKENVIHQKILEQVAQATRELNQIKEQRRLARIDFDKEKQNCQGMHNEVDKIRQDVEKWKRKLQQHRQDAQQAESRNKLLLEEQQKAQMQIQQLQQQIQQLTSKSNDSISSLRGNVFNGNNNGVTPARDSTNARIHGSHQQPTVSGSGQGGPPPSNRQQMGNHSATIRNEQSMAGQSQSNTSNNLNGRHSIHPTRIGASSSSQSQQSHLNNSNSNSGSQYRHRTHDSRHNSHQHSRSQTGHSDRTHTRPTVLQHSQKHNKLKNTTKPNIPSSSSRQNRVTNPLQTINTNSSTFHNNHSRISQSNQASLSTNNQVSMEQLANLENNPLVGNTVPTHLQKQSSLNSSNINRKRAHLVSPEARANDSNMGDS